MTTGDGAPGVMDPAIAALLQEALEAVERAGAESAARRAETERLRAALAAAEARVAALERARPALPGHPAATVGLARRLVPDAPILLTGRRAGSVVLRALLALVILGTFAATVPLWLGWQYYAVDSGSMEPTIPVGSLVFVKPAPVSALRVEDVITFATRDGGTSRFTHRIIALEGDPAAPTIRTKGDANSTEDQWTIDVRQPVGRVEGWVPTLGFVLLALSAAQAKYALGAVMLLVVGYSFAVSRQVQSPAHHASGPTGA